MAGQVGFFDYVKAAFLHHWNLLYLVGAAGIIALTPGVREPLVAAAAAIELGIVATAVGSARFRRAVNARQGAAESARSAEELARRYNALYSGLSRESKELFDQLKRRCEAMRQAGADGADFESLAGEKMAGTQLDGANRLLWVYLKLLHTHAALTRFLASTREAELDSLEAAAHAKLQDLPQAANETEMSMQMRRSLEDTLASVAARRGNLARAKENLDFVQLELARIASKVSALSEMTVARHDPAQITQQVDDAARSVESTEQAIGDLRIFNGLNADDMQAPPILTRPMPRERV
jgi:hypothetical protein